uniref:C2H2-type domain-containing protein n=1 Tax=Electrophorus electricus TaxID=8005 RepID=A0AAY5EEV0_ELEEL
MPRGFLVKRSNKRTSAASYRIRDEDKEMLVEYPYMTAANPIGEPWKSSPVTSDHAGLREDSADVESGANVADYAENYVSNPEFIRSPCSGNDSYSPTKPVIVELKQSFFDRCLSSPARAESFPLSTPVSSIERLLMSHGELKFDSPLHPYPPFQQSTKRSCIESDRKTKPPAKKPKVIRKLNFEDEVTTSPVLGLKIKKESPEPKVAPTSSGRKKPLGEFICQLCKEEYPDPFSLAQHKCSRIVRVEYRCPECDKVFSCPANLASHRRWHKPRNITNEPLSGKAPQHGDSLHDKSSVEGKENSSKARVNGQHLVTLDSAQCLRPTESTHGEDHLRRGSQEGPPSLDQPYASTEKCYELHRTSNDNARLFERCPEANDSSPAGYLSSPGGAEDVYGCHYCGKKFRRQAYLRKHLASGQITFPYQQVFSCKHCPSTFFSSPGLTRHINKSHPTETRQVMLLQMAVRPGC